ncbi:NmrA family NAD(P)-binding protein [Actinophytocola oryzae]|uniref:NmrA-like family protein n=1 Tax=Actinophytocola oryzae TaxID=502181 RepID=A0A4R7V4D5_9PSEU|nr:NmrA family NAD(P)-binding protein [Actinophytocola oryzae]TDV43614.1 NmrA-like family protein [Actinophytocola oryzae]
MTKKIIAVVGATGQQGGGVARAILDDPAGEFTVRALTRNPGSDAAKALAARGAEVVATDLDDGPSVRAALDGAYFVRGRARVEDGPGAVRDALTRLVRSFSGVPVTA